MSGPTHCSLALAALAVLTAPAGARQCEYGFQVLDLGGACGSCFGSSLQINEAGQMVGFDHTAALEFHAFIWDPASGIQDLGTLGGTFSYACCINEAGHVAGHAATASGDIHAFLWDPVNGMQDLGTLGGADSFATAINDLGQVAGNSETTEGTTRAFFWSAASGIQDLGTIVTNSRAVGLNNVGQVIGISYNTLGNINNHQTEPFVWDATNGLQPLQTVLGSAGVNSINDAGLIGGWVQNPFAPSPYVPSLFNANLPGATPNVLNGLVSSDCGEVTYVRGDGQAVGWQIQPGFPDCDPVFSLEDAYAWPGGLIPNTSFIETFAAIKITADDQVLLGSQGASVLYGYLASSPTSLAVRLDQLIPSGLKYFNLTPNDINDHGEVVGEALHIDGSSTPYVMWPCPPDINKDGAINVLDLIELLLAFGPCPPPPTRCPADTNKDGAVNVLDLIEMLLHFGEPGV